MNPIDMAALAKDAMVRQLDITPKPGLVDARHTGAHIDLTYDLMRRAIDALAPHLVTFGQTGLFVAEQSDEQVSAIMQKVGEAALQAVDEVTKGVNALRGTVLALGLTITAYYRGYRLGDNVQDAAVLSGHIRRLAAFIHRRKDSHGDWVQQSYNVGGALQSATEGYAWLLQEVLYLYRHMQGEDKDVRILLYIMSRLDDSCVYYRVGGELAANVKVMAGHVYEHYNREDVYTMCRYFERCHISTGGSGDMLTLLLLADKIVAQ